MTGTTVVCPHCGLKASPAPVYDAGLHPLLRRFDAEYDATWHLQAGGRPTYGPNGEVVPDNRNR